MKLAMAEPQLLKDSLGVVQELVNEVRLKATPAGLEITAMDPANVCMVIFRLKSECFTEYEPGDEIGVNLTNLKQMVRRAGSKDILKLETKDNQLHLFIGGKTTKHFSLPTIDIDEKEQKIPELNFTAKVRCDSEVFKQCIEDADIVAESVLFIAQGSKFSMNAEGDLSKVVVDMGTASVTATPEAIKAKYSIEYLKKFVSASKLSENVNVNFAKDYPLMLEYKLENKLELSFILAPRVENSD